MIRIIEQIDTYKNDDNTFYLERKSFWGWKEIFKTELSTRDLITFTSYSDAEEYILYKFSDGIVLKNGNVYSYITPNYYV